MGWTGAKVATASTSTSKINKYLFVATPQAAETSK